MTKGRVYLAGLTLAVVATAAQADITFTPAVVSDYDFRGVSQNAKDPALQLGVDTTSGPIHVGAWTSQVNFGGSSTEIDWVADYTFGGEETVKWNSGIVYYTYPGGVSYPEVWFMGTKGWFSAAVRYSHDWANTSQDAAYFEGNVAFPLGDSGFSVTAHYGMSDGQAFTYATSPTTEFDASYSDYSIGVAATLGKFNLALKWVDNDIDDDSPLFSTDDVLNTEDRVILSVSTTLPW